MRCRTAAILLSWTALTGPLAHAAGWSTTDRSVVAMGSGGAGSVRGDDPGVNAYNPASGVMQPGLGASLGLLLAFPAIEAAGVGTNASLIGGPSIPPFVHLRWVGDVFACGASLSVPFGSRLEWPREWARRFELVRAEVQDLRLSVFGALRLGSVSLAIGPSFDFGRLVFERALDFVDTEGVASVETTAFGAGLHAAVFGDLTEDIGLGLSFQSRTLLAFDGFADFDVPPEFSGRAGDQAVSTRVLLPDRFTVGLEWRIDARWRLLVDLEATLWATIDELVIDFEDERTDDLVLRRNWSTTLTPRVGGAFALSDGVELRAGIFLDPSPVPQETVGPSSPDSTRLGFSVGAGLSLPFGTSLDLAYQYLLFVGESSPVDGIEYDGHADILGLALSMHR